MQVFLQAEALHSITVNESTTVGDLKEAISVVCFVTYSCFPKCRNVSVSRRCKLYFFAFCRLKVYHVKNKSYCTVVYR